MSGRIPTKERLMAWVDDYAAREDLDAARTLFLTKFASYASAASESWAKVDTLMRQCRCSERMLQKMRAEFEAAGVLENTGRFHTLEESGRRVPLYRWAMFLDEFEGGSRGAPCAPEREPGVHRTEPSGAQGVHPHNELKELTPSDEGDAGAREAVFNRLEAAFPKLGLGATFRDRARSALKVLLDEGLNPDDLVEAAKRYAADRSWKRKDLGLDHWLHDRRFRAWWPDATLPLGEAGPEGDVRKPPSLPRDVAEAVYPAGLTNYLGGATWQEDGRMLVCRLGIQADEVRKRVGKALTALGVTVISTKDFEAHGRQQGVG